MCRMKARRITAKLIATPEEQAALLTLLERERNHLVESGASETPLGRALWAATDGVGAALESHTRRRSGMVDLASKKARFSPGG